MDGVGEEKAQSMKKMKGLGGGGESAYVQPVEISALAVYIAGKCRITCILSPQGTPQGMVNMTKKNEKRGMMDCSGGGEKSMHMYDVCILFHVRMHCCCAYVVFS